MFIFHSGDLNVNLGRAVGLRLEFKSCHHKDIMKPSPCDASKIWFSFFAGQTRCIGCMDRVAHFKWERGAVLFQSTQSECGLQACFNSSRLGNIPFNLCRFSSQSVNAVLLLYVPVVLYIMSINSTDNNLLLFDTITNICSRKIAAILKWSRKWKDQAFTDINLKNKTPLAV